jgi:hypothetical protein
MNTYLFVDIVVVAKGESVEVGMKIKDDISIAVDIVVALAESILYQTLMLYLRFRKGKKDGN